MEVLQCCVWLLAEMPWSRAGFDLNNRKSGVNWHLRFCQFPKNSEACRVGWVLFIKLWHHRQNISELKYALTHGTFPSFFGNWQNRRCLLTADLRLFKSNPGRDESISANGQTQYWRTAIFWLAVTSLHALFLRQIEESSQTSIFF